MIIHDKETLNRHIDFLKFIKNNSNKIKFEEYTILLDVFYKDILKLKSKKEFKNVA